MAADMTIRLTGIDVDQNKLTYQTQIGAALTSYFSGGSFTIEYPITLTDIPASVLAVPFVGTMLPIAWLTGAEIVVPELDQAFYDCIPRVVGGYGVIYPNAALKGSVRADRLVKNDSPGDSAAALFSGGVDSFDTLLTHYGEQPRMLAIWGADVEYDNRRGWDEVERLLQSTSALLKLPYDVIRTSFRTFDNYFTLSRLSEPLLGSNYWYGLSSSISMLSHTAPLAYARGIGTLYIAASNSRRMDDLMGYDPCASNPFSDNEVRFAGCRVVHDGYEKIRQEKIENIVDICTQKIGRPAPVRVCYLSDDGHNCCRCEKCYRTIAGFLAAGASPEDYGFPYSIRLMAQMEPFLLQDRSMFDTTVKTDWWAIPERMRKVKHPSKSLRRYWPYVKWVRDVDFEHPEKLRVPLRTKCVIFACDRYDDLKALRRKVSRSK